MDCGCGSSMECPGDDDGSRWPINLLIEKESYEAVMCPLIQRRSEGVKIA